MELEITPEPSDEERAAIAAALAAAGADAERVPAGYASRWRAAGLAEAAGGADDEPAP